MTYFFPRIENIIPLKGFSENNMRSLYLFFDDLLFRSCDHGVFHIHASEQAVYVRQVR